MARITLDLDQTILHKLRLRSAREGKTVGQVASELLARAISQPSDLPAPEFRWTVADLGMPRVDLEDPEAVRHVVDDDR